MNFIDGGSQVILQVPVAVASAHGKIDFHLLMVTVVGDAVEEWEEIKVLRNLCFFNIFLDHERRQDE